MKKAILFFLNFSLFCSCFTKHESEITQYNGEGFEKKIIQKNLDAENFDASIKFINKEHGINEDENNSCHLMVILKLRKKDNSISALYPKNTYVNINGMRFLPVLDHVESELNQGEIVSSFLFYLDKSDIIKNGLHFSFTVNEDSNEIYFSNIEFQKILA